MDTQKLGTKQKTKKEVNNMKLNLYPFFALVFASFCVMFGVLTKGSNVNYMLTPIVLSVIGFMLAIKFWEN